MDRFAKRLGGKTKTRIEAVFLAPNPGLQPVGRMLAKGLMVKLLRAHGGCLGVRKR